MDPILQRFLDAASRKNAVDEEEVDRIPGTSKIRTYCANSSLYSRESSLEVMIQAAHLFTDDPPANH